MNPQEMLKVLNDHGEDAGADFNDGDDVLGWFGWSITEHGSGPERRLTVTHESAHGGKKTATWQLVPLTAEG